MDAAVSGFAVVMRPAIIILGAIMFLSGCGTPSPPTHGKYNFLLIMADDLSAYDVPAYGRSRDDVQTPHLDRLAAEGMRFETCWATPLCTPSRVEILTGQYGFRTGYYNFLGRVYAPREDSPRYDIGTNTTFADVLRDAGYATGVAGKWQLTGQVPELVHDCGFDEYFIWQWLHDLPEGVEHTGAWQNRRRTVPERFWNPGIISNGEYVPTKPTDYGPDLFTDFLIDFMRRNRERPFLAYYPMALTHTPWRPTPDWRVHGRRTAGGFAANLEYLDHVVGRLVRSVDRLGLGENTIIIFTGDNGTQGRGKASIERMGMHVPLIVRCPGTVPKRADTDALTDFTDILPTLADFAGASVPSHHTQDGVSLAPTLRGESDRHREWIFSYLADERVIRDEEWMMDGDGRLRPLPTDRRPRRMADPLEEPLSPDARQARDRLAAILRTLPGPENDDDLNLPADPGEPE